MQKWQNRDIEVFDVTLQRHWKHQESTKTSTNKAIHFQRLINPMMHARTFHVVETTYYLQKKREHESFIYEIVCTLFSSDL